MHSLRRVALAVGLAMLAPLALRSQEPAFHAAQWGAEVGLGSSNSATLLRFTSPSAAWLLSFDGSFTRLKAEGPGGTGTTSTTSTGWNGAVRLGHRWYSSGAGSIRPFHSVGVLTSYNHVDDDTRTVRSWTGGGFFDLGASWLLNAHVGLGASGEINAAYTSAKTEATIGGVSQEITGKGWSVGVGRLRVLASVYF